MKILYEIFNLRAVAYTIRAVHMVRSSAYIATLDERKRNNTNTVNQQTAVVRIAHLHLVHLLQRRRNLSWIDWVTITFGVARDETERSQTTNE